MASSTCSAWAPDLTFAMFLPSLHLSRISPLLEMRKGSRAEKPSLVPKMGSLSSAPKLGDLPVLVGQQLDLAALVGGRQRLHLLHGHPMLREVAGQLVELVRLGRAARGVALLEE